MIKDWNFWFSVITAMAAMIALILTVMQMRLSNKQNLFDRRLDCYLKTNGLIKLYSENRALLEQNREDQPMFAVDFEFSLLTNNTYLAEIGESIKKPLEAPGHQKFLTKQEELKELASKVDLIFKGREKKKISYFILSYAQLLKKIYQYQILLNTLQKNSEDYHKTLEQAQKAVNEMHYRKELLEAYTNLKESYLQVEKSNSLEKLKKQIQL